MPQTVLTPEEKQKCKEAVSRTYCVIAEDCGFKDNASATTILEVVLDADYVRAYGRIDHELYDRFHAYVQETLKEAKTFKSGLKQLAKEFWN
jgi:hypothetical protein